MSLETLDPQLLENLARPEGHPGDPTAARGVTWIQTHISHVFLTAARVVKLRKPVRLSFLDFSTRDARNRDAKRELQLNRRLAADVYRGLAPLHRGDDGRWRVGALREELEGGEPPPEHAVVMRRLPEGRDGRSLLEAGRLLDVQLEAVARVLARFHAGQGLGRPAPWSPEVWRERTAAPVRANFESLREAGAQAVDPDAVVAAARASEARLRTLAPALERRRQEGRAVDGHGDLHLEHVWFEEDAAEPILIDCIEFDAELRRIDVASEVAFLAMDLRYRGARRLAARFLSAYAAHADDYGLFELVDFFAAYRAAVRAKVAALASAEEEMAAQQRRGAARSARRHLSLAGELLEPRRPGVLVLVCGTVGVGKSTVARRLGELLAGVVVRSDWVRKRMAGLAPTQRTGVAPDAGLYDPAFSERVYAGLLERAEPVLRSGRTVILDATFARRAHREAARARADALGASFHRVHVECAASVARARLAQRAARGTDVSDAGPERVDPSRQRFEPLELLPSASAHRLCTDRDAPEMLDANLQRLARAIRPDLEGLHDRS